MKILFLNPHLYDSPLIGTLRGLGVAVIVCSDFRECELVFKLHSGSVSLFVGHDQDGVSMNDLLKHSARFATTPVILTTSQWTDKQCIEHQSTAFGANAYVRLPVDDKEFIHVIDQILGTELSHGKGFRVSDDLTRLGSMEASSPGLALVSEPANESTHLAIATATNGGVQLEDAAALYGKPAAPSEPTAGFDPTVLFTLESPETDRAIALEVAPEGDRTGVSIVSEVLATPIEATSLDTLGPSAEDLLPRVESIGLNPEKSGIFSHSTPIVPTPVQAPIQTTSTDLDAEALEAMPYLGRNEYPNPLAAREPMDDAVVPGGAVNAPDTETLKKYLYLREQDVTALSAQLRQAREQIGLLEGQLKHERAVSTEFAHLAQEQDRRIDGFEKEKSVALESAQKEYDDLKFEMKRRSEKIRVMELQVREATEATERLKERVRLDIRKIRTREKELENRLEIMKKDSEALLGAREQKIIELKRKLDLMEFNTDLVQDILEKERQTSSSLREKLAKAAQMMRVAGGILGPDADAIVESSLGSDSGVNKDDRSTAA